jgi:diaminopimelate decarboxylase
MHKLSLFPQTTDINSKNHLLIGGCDTVELAFSYGTPLYLFDEVTLRNKCAEFRREFSQRYSNVLIIYACKAFINPTLLLLFKEEGLGLDVVSGGEISIARYVDFPSDVVYFHGNNKTVAEIKLALERRIGHVVIDNLDELRLLSKMAEERGIVQDVLLRLSPGIDPHTHKYIATGLIDSKFGFPIATGQAEEALACAISTPSLNLIGLHFHLGSSIFEMEPYSEAIKVIFQFVAEAKEKYDFEFKEFSPGGGFAIQYVLGSPAPSIAEYAEVITSVLLERSKALGIPPPQLIVEPGRAIVGQAGVALYSVGAIKEIPGVRKYVFIDGGIADNIRPALYGSKYEALLASKAREEETERVTIGGRFCESGDILTKDVNLPKLSAGDIIAVPTCGAYCLPLASNYNVSLKPAIVLVKEGQVLLMRRRETYEDLIRNEFILKNS